MPNIGVIFGGRSGEHEVSLVSASTVIDNIPDGYSALPIGISRDGKWFTGPNVLEEFKTGNLATSEELSINFTTDGKAHFSSKSKEYIVDVIFPVLHGTCGEDGTVQGVLKLLNLPFVGASVLGSAVGMDKDVMKRLLRDALIPTPEFLVFRDFQKESINFNQIEKALGSPCYVKPANLGSSVGIHRVTSASELKAAVEDAFQYDTKILIEEAVEGREIECSVLGNEFPEASVPGEIITNHEKHQFYSYEAKYLDQNGALLRIPAELEPEVAEKIRDLAIKSYQAICCEGMARVDFFLRDETEIYVNELNTIPGFTIISMYPKLWEASGISYAELIDRLIQLALQRQEKEKELKTSV